MNAPRPRKPKAVTVVYDPDAVLDLEEVKGRDERKALFNAVDNRAGSARSSPRRTRSP